MILTREQRVDVLTQLSEVLEVSPVDGEVIDMALHSGWTDFEDAVQNFSAVADPYVDGVITRNVKDFKASELEVVDSVEFLTKQHRGDFD